MKKFLSLLLFSGLLLSGCTEVEYGSHLFKSSSYNPSTSTAPTGGPLQQGNFKVGKPYTVNGTVYRPQESYDYLETGIASWYGPGFHGKKTASGEIYDNNELTAAHRTLQMPSFVRVTNLQNGKSVIVRINDRGPFAKGRIIDVSKRAAELLDMTRAGTAQVKVEMMAEQSRLIAQAARGGQNVKGTEVAMNTHGRLPDHIQTSYVDASPQTPEESLAQAARQNNIEGHYSNGRFYPDAVATQTAVMPTSLYVQAGAFGVQENAARLSASLNAIAPAQVVPVYAGGRTLYKVRLGPLQNVREADMVLNRVTSSGHSDALIIVQ